MGVRRRDIFFGCFCLVRSVLCCSHGDKEVADILNLPVLMLPPMKSSVMYLLGWSCVHFFPASLGALDWSAFPNKTGGKYMHLSRR